MNDQLTDNYIDEKLETIANELKAIRKAKRRYKSHPEERKYWTEKFPKSILHIIYMCYCILKEWSN